MRHQRQQENTDHVIPAKISVVILAAYNSNEATGFLVLPADHLAASQPNITVYNRTEQIKRRRAASEYILEMGMLGV